MIAAALLPFGLVMWLGIALLACGKTCAGLVAFTVGCAATCLYLRSLGRR